MASRRKKLTTKQRKLLGALGLLGGAALAFKGGKGIKAVKKFKTKNFGRSGKHVLASQRRAARVVAKSFEHGSSYQRVQRLNKVLWGRANQLTNRQMFRNPIKAIKNKREMTRAKRLLDFMDQ